MFCNTKKSETHIELSWHQFSVYFKLCTWKTSPSIISLSWPQSVHAVEIFQGTFQEMLHQVKKKRTEKRNVLSPNQERHRKPKQHITSNPAFLFISAQRMGAHFTLPFLPHASFFHAFLPPSLSLLAQEKSGRLTGTTKWEEQTLEPQSPNDSEGGLLLKKKKKKI